LEVEMKRAFSMWRTGLRRVSLGAIVATVAVMVRPGSANDEVPHEARGHERSGYALSDYENINLANGNLTFRVPLATVSTDGGLSWQVALHHNSKVWYTHRYCTLVPPGYDSCQAAGGAILDATIAHGVEEFGFGWDLRPPRILLRRSVPFARQPAYVDETGAKRSLVGAPPWDLEGEHRSGEGVEWEEGDRLYTRDGSNLRFTVLDADVSGRPLRVEMENGHGDVYVFAHVVAASCDATGVLTPGADLAAHNFRVDVSGLYLTEIQRGPWSAGGPANRITFDYAAPGSHWDADCGWSGPRPWLPVRVSAAGEVTRAVEIDYDPGTWTIQRLRVPAFNPVIGDPEPSTDSEEIVLITDLRTFDQRNGASWFSFEAVHLTGVELPDGSSFRFDQLLPYGGAPLADVTLPSGGQVVYGHGPYPVGRGRCDDNVDDGGDCPFWLTCGARVPRVQEETSRTLSSDGVTSRSISYHDAATTAASPRRETTWFVQGLNCAVSPHFTTLPVDLRPWPYDFDWALRDDAGLQHPEYLWTVVYTAAGTAGPGSQGVAEIHRFHPLTREEFSVDLLAGDSDALAELPMEALMGVEDLSGASLRVLRHTEIEHELRFGPNYPSVTEGEDRYTFVREWRGFTDEASGDASLADVETCHPPVFADPVGPPSVTVSCTEVRETTEVDHFLNRVARTLESRRSTTGIEVQRSWQHEYRLHDAEATWYLHRETGRRVCEGPSCSLESRSWVDLSQPGSRSWFDVGEEVVNPDAAGGCSEDCIRRVHGYDASGNRERTALAGGYGVGFGDLELTTRTEYRHGQPVRRVLEGGGDSLLAWQREVDPGTGLVRWHLSGAGAGFAYGYDGAGRLIDIAPIEGDLTGGSWLLELQQAANGEEMLGSYLERIPPIPSRLLRHELRDAVYRLAEVPGGRRLLPSWVDPEPSTRVRFDGLGRATLWTERYPSGSGTRSRMELDLYHDGQDVCGSGQGTGPEPAARLRIASEWRDDAEWSWCGDLDWTVSLLDPLGRPAVVRLPDGSESYLTYVGDRQRSVARWLATDPGGGQQLLLSTVRLEDALGRLRGLGEEVRPGVAYSADYEYDHHDRLVSARLWEGAPGASPAQVSGWSYSAAGFPTAVVEPELATSYLGWDAGGHVHASVAGGSRLDVSYDGLGRRVGTTVNGVPAAFWLWGDARPGDPAAAGDPAYGKVVEAVQHNRFASDDVPVASAWSFGGPGGRVDTRTTRIGGVGTTDDRFEVGYTYDRWGNVERVDHPSWVPWPLGCQEPTRENRVSEGSWLIRTSATVGDAMIPVVAAEREFQASGRVAETDYLADDWVVGRLVEEADSSGMPRPHHLELWWSEAPGDSLLRWYEGPFDYDGSGNVIRIGGRRFAYDGLDRVTAFHDLGDPVEVYEWDRWGNLTELENTDHDHGGAFTLRLHGTGDDNRPETVIVDGAGSGALGWDPRGNLTSIPTLGHLRGKQLVHSGEDRLLEVEDTASGTAWRFAYDVSGERVASWRRDGDGTLAEVRLHLRDEAGALLSDWILLPTDDFGPLRDYVRAEDRIVAQLDWVAGEPSPTYLAHDHLGSTRVIIEPDGTMTDLLEYSSFGGLRAGGPVPGARLLFTGHERDVGATSSELDYMHARYYSPALARFASLDSVGGEPGSSQSWNRYLYTRNNPLRAVDPTGLYEQDVHRSLTAVLALAAGFDAKTAGTIAAANQAVDDDRSTGAFAGRSARQNYHFTSESRRKVLWESFASSKSADDLGVYLHSLQDSYSHAEFGASVGHLFAGHAPDKTYNDPSRADEMAAATYTRIAAAAEALGINSARRLPYAALSEMIQRFNDARTEQEKDGIMHRMRMLVTQHRESSQNEHGD
jgi:RHS repeat-associated protein